MDQPVGLSFLGGLLIVVAAGCGAGLVARALRRPSMARTGLDVGLGILGGLGVIFVLPMNGFTLGALTGWPGALALGTGLPVVVGHLLVPVRARDRRAPPPG